MKTSTLPHKVQPSRYALHLLRLWIRRNAWWAFGIPVTASLILAMLVDLKFIYIAVILVCLILPHVFINVYWHHLLSDRTCRWLLPHTMTLVDGQIVTEYISETDSDNTDGEQTTVRPTFSIATDSVNRCRLTEDEMILNISNDPYDIIIIPISAFHDTTSIKDWYRTLSRHNAKYKS